MSDFKLDHPNFEWEGRQTCVMTSDELLDILGKESEKREISVSGDFVFIRYNSIVFNLQIRKNI